MDRKSTQVLTAVGLSLLSGGLFWSGYATLTSGRDDNAFAAPFDWAPLLGSHMLWLLSGAVSSGILEIGSRQERGKPIAPLLASAVLPIVVIVSIYVWIYPSAPLWLPTIPSRYLWLLSPTTQAIAAASVGLLLGSAALRRLPPILRRPQRDRSPR